MLLLQLAHMLLAQATWQTLPHTPQLFLSLVVLISQPFGYCLSQSAKPLLQVATAHAPLAHAVDATLAVFGHALPHMPHLLGSLLVLDSQPLAYFISQSLNPFRQPVITHIELAQLKVAFGTAPHGWLHPPQLLRSDVVFASHPVL